MLKGSALLSPSSLYDEETRIFHLAFSFIVRAIMSECGLSRSFCSDLLAVLNPIPVVLQKVPMHRCIQGFRDTDNLIFTQPTKRRSDRDKRNGLHLVELTAKFSTILCMMPFEHHNEPSVNR